MADGKVTINVDLDGKQAQGEVKTLKSLLQGLGGTGSKVGSIFKSVLGANLISGAFMGAISTAKSGITSLMGEAVSASDTLYKFEQTMGFGGYDGETIKQARADVKKYADETVYDIEDIANTTAQLAANGITNFKQLTESAGNLNAVAGGNANTFKTVGMVMTQTAGAGKLTTENWNQLANAIPGASGKLQKAMLDAGAYTGNFREAMEKGEITADEFNAAIISLGESQKEAATSTATVEGAVGNLRATISSGLLTVMDKIKPKVTEMINAFSEMAGKINFDEVAAIIDEGLTKVGQFFDKFKDTGALSAAGQALKDIGAALGNLFAALGGGKGDWTDFGTTLGNIVAKLSEAASAISGFIAKMKPGQLQSWIATFASVIGGFKLFSAITGSSPISAILGKLGEKFAIFGQKGEEGSNRASRGGSLVTKIFNGLGTVITKLGTGLSTAFKGLGTGLATAFKGLGTGISTAAQGIGKGISIIANGFASAASKANPAQWLSMGAAMLMVGAGVALVAGGIYILVQAAIQLGSAGTSAQLALVGLGVGIAALAGIFALLGPALSAGAIGIVAFGAAIALIGVGVYVASAGLSMLAGHLPTIATHGASAAIGIAALGAGLLVMGAGALVAGAGALVLGAGLLVAGAGATVFGAGMLVAAAGVAAFGLALNVCKPGVTAFANAITKVINAISGGLVAILNSISGVIESVGKAALNAGKGFNQLATGVSKITKLNLFDMGASLTAVATGVAAIAASGSGLTSAGNGMTALGKGMQMVSLSATTAVTGLTTFATRITTLSTSVTTLPAMLTTASAGFASFTAQAVSGVAGLSAINAPIAMFKSQIMTITPALMMASVGFASFSAQAIVVGGALSGLGGRITMLGTALVVVSAGFTQVSSSASNASIQVTKMASSTQAVISAFNSMRGQVQSSMQAILSVITSVGNQMRSQGRQIGQQTAQNLAQGIRGGIGQSQGAMQALMSAVRSVGMSGVGSMRGIGAMIGQGLAQGMYSALGAVTAAANALIAQAERAAKAKAQIHSPSRLFQNAIGRFLPMGVAVGVEKNTKYVDKAMDGMYEHINAFNFKAEDVIGVGKTKLSKVIQVKSDLENAVKATVEVAKEKSNNLIEKALDVAEKAVERPAEMRLDDGTLVAKTGDKFSSYQAEQLRRENRMKGIIT